MSQPLPLMGAAGLLPRQASVLYRAARSLDAAQNVGGYLGACMQSDELKAKWARALFAAPQAGRELLAQHTARLVEALHGKEGQTRNAIAVAKMLCSIDAARGPVDDTASSEPDLEGETVRVVSLLNLGELRDAPALAYCRDGRPTPEDRANYAMRAPRLASLLRELGIGDDRIWGIAADSHIDAARPRTDAAQTADLSERLAAMTQDRPSGRAKSNVVVLEQLRSWEQQGLFAAPLCTKARALIAAGALANGKLPESGEL